MSCVAYAAVMFIIGAFAAVLLLIVVCLCCCGSGGGGGGGGVGGGGGDTVMYVFWVLYTCFNLVNGFVHCFRVCVGVIQVLFKVFSRGKDYLTVVLYIVIIHIAPPPPPPPTVPRKR